MWRHRRGTLIDLLRETAAAQGRTVMPDPEPGKGFYYRSDHFEFAKQGVPALYVDPGTQYIGKDAEFGVVFQKLVSGL
jgi:Zn-dependent M28 family amino/carboxypeptidase